MRYILLPFHYQKNIIHSHQRQDSQKIALMVQFPNAITPMEIPLFHSHIRATAIGPFALVTVWPADLHWNNKSDIRVSVSDSHRQNAFLLPTTN